MGRINEHYKNADDIVVSESKLIYYLGKKKPSHLFKNALEIEFGRNCEVHKVKHSRMVA